MARFLLLLGLLSSVSASTNHFLFDRPICTGLGDRVGTMLSLAALARLENGSIIYLWCKDPSVIMQATRTFVPKWSGFNYSLDEFKSLFHPPREIVFVSNLLQ